MNISIRPKRLPFDLAEMALRVAYRFLDEWDETITLFKAEAASYVGHGYNKGIKYTVVLSVPVTSNTDGPKAEFTAILEIIYDREVYSICYLDKDSSVPIVISHGNIYQVRGAGFYETSLQISLVYNAITAGLNTWVEKMKGRIKRVTDFSETLTLPTMPPTS
ncbi:MAG: hypothetical protein A3A61_00045 [Candidatus Woykebacteria bacterium RIFCSPLOWO2_01_FULL_43_14]|uniref:Uncharacterized protein n=1 Tax=Candidatus Woykebacteria bacterium RIFCSPLOWO2_01_FULL_43_14 TaxID=1802605 RepID=A0A1G1WX74_9BACT|nr:MAG: hypothetical protein A3A61_00045 [Candidatus Woykebacteria bacterium RIFCSPLOWO2_01_FULL_43_14]